MRYLLVIVFPLLICGCGRESKTEIALKELQKQNEEHIQEIKTLRSLLTDMRRDLDRVRKKVGPLGEKEAILWNEYPNPGYNGDPKGDDSLAKINYGIGKLLDEKALHAVAGGSGWLLYANRKTAKKLGQEIYVAIPPVTSRSLVSGKEALNFAKKFKIFARSPFVKIPALGLTVFSEAYAGKRAYDQTVDHYYPTISEENVFDFTPAPIVSAPTAKNLPPTPPSSSEPASPPASVPASP